MKQKTLIIAFTGLLIVIFLNLGSGSPQEQARHSDVDFTLSCRECHSEATPEIYQQWKSSAHGIMNFSCYMCHGDGQVEFYPRPGSERCVGCHSPQEVDFTKLKVENCFDCHQGHTLKFHHEE